MDFDILTENAYKSVQIICYEKEKALFQCRHNATNKEYAIKRLLFSGEEKEFERVINERISMWQSLKHPNIVELSNYIQTEFDNNSVNYFMATEFCETSLHEWFKSHADRSLKTCETMIQQIMDGLIYLNEKKIMHGNLKPHNILINSNNVCQLTDFEITGTDMRSLLTTKTPLNTSLYISPDKLKTYEKVDIYPFGIVIMEFYTLLKSEGRTQERMDVINKLRANDVCPQFFANFDVMDHSNYYANLKRLVVKMIQTDPDYRPDIIEVNRLFSSIEKEQQIFNTHLTNKNEDLIKRRLRELDIGQQERYGKEFVERGRLGKGSYGAVYKVLYKGDRRPYAVKKVNLNANVIYRRNVDMHSDDNIEKILREIKNWKDLKHKFIVDYKSAWYELNNDTSSDSDSGPLPALHIQMQLCKCNVEVAFNQIHIELNQISENSLTPVGAYIASHLFIDIVEGVDYLHSRDPAIMHRDIKMNNILLANDWTVKISDFGLSKQHYYSMLSQSHTENVGNVEHRAPEVENGEYCPLADIYGLGVMFTKMCKISDKTRKKWIRKGSVKFMADTEETHEWYPFYRAMKSIFENVMKLLGSREDRPTSADILRAKLDYMLSYDCIRNDKLFQQKIGDENSGLITYELLTKYI